MIADLSKVCSMSCISAHRSRKNFFSYVKSLFPGNADDRDSAFTRRCRYRRNCFAWLVRLMYEFHKEKIYHKYFIITNIYLQSIVLLEYKIHKAVRQFEQLSLAQHWEMNMS